LWEPSGFPQLPPTFSTGKTTVTFPTCHVPSAKKGGKISNPSRGPGPEGGETAEPQAGWISSRSRDWQKIVRPQIGRGPADWQKKVSASKAFWFFGIEGGPGKKVVVLPVAGLLKLKWDDGTRRGSAGRLSAGDFLFPALLSRELMCFSLSVVMKWMVKKRQRLSKS